MPDIEKVRKNVKQNKEKLGVLSKEETTHEEEIIFTHEDYQDLIQKVKEAEDYFDIF